MDSGLGGLGNTLSQHLILSSDRISGDKDRQRLESDLGAIEGVRNVTVDTDRHTVDIEYDPTIVDEVRLRVVVEEAGYRFSDQAKRDEADAYLENELTQVDQEGGGQGGNTPGSVDFNPRDLPGAARDFEE